MEFREITFSAESNDLDGDVIEHKWISSKDGVISKSENFTISNLTSGYHNITYVVRHDSGLWSVPSNGVVYLNQRPSVEIISITPENGESGTVTCDFNHPMAGKALTFEVEVMEITEAAEDSHCCSDPGCSSNQ